MKRLTTLIQLLLFAFITTSLSAELKSYRINSFEYYRLIDFLRLDSDIKAQIHPLRLTALIKKNNTAVRLSFGESFYFVNDLKMELKLPPVYVKSELFIPRELTEELIADFRMPIEYRFAKQKLKAVAKKRVKIPDKLDFIVIDPGHGGKDPGAPGFGGEREKDIVLRLSRNLYRALKIAFPETRIYVTRSRDIFLGLDKRSRLANKKNEANNFGIFLSIHANSTLSPRVHGFELFYLSTNRQNEESRELMLRENGGSENEFIRKLESRLMNGQIQAESKVLAIQLHNAMVGSLNGVVSSRGIKRADFAVLRGALMPAVLVETGYISNKNEVQVLKSHRYKEKFTEGIIQGIRKFIKERPRL